nr:uncharacterized protein LOC106679743 [Halyomorpha halys]
MGEKLNASMKSDKVLFRLHRSNESLASPNLNLSSQIFELHSLIDGNPRIRRLSSRTPQLVRASSDGSSWSVTNSSLNKISEHSENRYSTSVVNTSWEVVQRKVSTVSSLDGYRYLNTFTGRKTEERQMK